MGIKRTAAVAAGIGTLGAALWWRKNPSPCPYWQRFFVQAPHPGITSKRLIGTLDPRPGERILEVGPGTGYYSFDVAERLGSPGKLEVFDIQQDMLDHVMQIASERRVTNITPTQGDAQAMPYPDAAFDGTFLVTVLGEIPDQQAGLGEIARVLRPGGRLVVGELFGDPHYVALGAMQAKAQEAGLNFEQRTGSPLAFYATFVKPG